MSGALLRGLAALLLALSGMVAAQGVSSTGTDNASLTLGGRLIVTPRLQLRLSTTELVFDTRSGSERASGQVCVGGSGEDIPINPSTLGGDRLAPAGTDYRVTTFPTIDVVGGEPLNNAPLAQAANDAVVCYRTFTLRVFSNEGAWQVRADRFDPVDTPGIRRLYLGASCPEHTQTGLAALPEGGTTTLVSGKVPGECQNLLVVVALKITDETAGTSIAGIRYTLMSLGGALSGDEHAR